MEYSSLRREKIRKTTMLTNDEISELLVKYPRQYQAYLKKHKEVFNNGNTK